MDPKEIGGSSESHWEKPERGLVSRKEILSRLPGQLSETEAQTSDGQWAGPDVDWSCLGCCFCLLFYF